MSCTTECYGILILVNYWQLCSTETSQTFTHSLSVPSVVSITWRYFLIGVQKSSLWIKNEVFVFTGQCSQLQGAFTAPYLQHQCAFTVLSSQLQCAYTALCLQLQCAFTAMCIKLQCVFTSLCSQIRWTFTALCSQLQCAFTVVITTSVSVHGDVFIF